MPATPGKGQKRKYVPKVVPYGYNSIDGFHSRSPKAEYRYLSNFQAIPGGLHCIVDLSFRGALRLMPGDAFVSVPDTYAISAPLTVTAASVERVFQALKYLFVIGKSEEERRTLFIDAIGVIPEGADLTAFAGVNSKHLSNKRAFFTRGISLDIITWNRIKHAIMKRLVGLRFQFDAKFRNIIYAAREQKIYLYHIMSRKQIFDPTTGVYITGSDALGDYVRELTPFHSLSDSSLDSRRCGGCGYDGDGGCCSQAGEFVRCVTCKSWSGTCICRRGLLSM